MPGVLWLASYPKSGNTWIRAFLANYLVNGDVPLSINELPEFVRGDGPKHYYEGVLGFPIEGALSIKETQELRLILHEKFAQESENTTIVKTHNAIAFLEDIPTINPDATEGAVYIIRNPFDVAVSYAHHYGMTYDEAIEKLNSEQNALGGTERQVFQFLGTWSQHALSWLEAPEMKIRLIRYEDMFQRPKETFKGLLDFLDLPDEPERCDKAISFSSFESLSKQEVSTGFVEAIPAKDHAAFMGKEVADIPETASFQGERRVRFFRKGRIGLWREELSSDQVMRIIKNHRTVMEMHGYLDSDGSPVF